MQLLHARGRAVLEEGDALDLNVHIFPPRKPPFGPLSAGRAHTNAPHKTDLLRGMRRARNRPGRARTVKGDVEAVAHGFRDHEHCARPYPQPQNSPGDENCMAACMQSAVEKGRRCATGGR